MTEDATIRKYASKKREHADLSNAAEVKSNEFKCWNSKQEIILNSDKKI